MTLLHALQKLKEDPLRQKVIIPLLNGLGCHKVRDFCGPRENGKDIIYCKEHFLNKTIFGAVVLKTTGITKAKISNLERQINEAISLFTCPDEPANKIRIHEIIVITSRGITEDAKEYIHQHCCRNFPSVHFVDGTYLEYLINKVIIEYSANMESPYIFNVDTFGNIFGQKIKNAITMKEIIQEGKVIREFL
jgi:hypothetical protein